MERTTEFNPYQAPAAELLSDRFSPEDIQHYEAYVGKKSSYYMKHWFKLRQGINADSGFNFAALFYGPLWFLYRKMYLHFVAICLILIGEGAVEHYIFKMSPFALDTILSISNVFGLCLSFSCAFYANRWYFNHVTRKIRAARSSEFKEKSIAKVLKRGGGTDFLSPLTFIIALALILYAAMTFRLVA